MGIKRQRDFALALQSQRGLDYWGGTTWVFSGNIRNDGANLGDHVYTISPGQDNEMELLYGILTNGDLSTRSGQVIITDDDGNQIVTFIQGEGINISAGGNICFPSSDNPSGAGTSVGSGQRFIVSGDMRLVATLSNVAINNDSIYAVACRIRGRKPTVRFTSPAGAVETVDKDQVF